MTASPPITVVRDVVLARPELHSNLIWEVSFCVVPAMTLVALSETRLGAYALFLTLGFFMIRHLGRQCPVEAATVVIGTIPVMMLLRGLFLYSSIQGIMFISLFALMSEPKDRERFWQNRPLVLFIGFSVIYWLSSFILTGDYSSNIRALEFSLTAANIYVLAGHRSYLASALVSLVISSATMAISLLQLGGSRLGTLTTEEDITIGNPIAIGVSASVGYLLTIADRGRWLLLHHRMTARIVFNLLAAATLVLSTSRGSWLVTLVGIVLTFALNRASRFTMTVCTICLIGLLAVILQTERGVDVEHFYDNALGGDKTLDKRTTGRANQWESFPAVFDASPIWGFGPGSGKSVSLKYTKEGKVWHSLYLQIGAETGSLGLAALALLLGTLIRKGARHRKTCAEVVPLLSIICFMVIAVSVSGVDSISGVFLGLAFTGEDYSPMRRVLTGSHLPDESVAAA